MKYIKSFLWISLILLCLFENGLYVLCASFGDKYKVNTIIEFSLIPTMGIDDIYILSGQIYNKICATEKYIFASNKLRNTLERFVIPEI